MEHEMDTEIATNLRARTSSARRVRAHRGDTSRPVGHAEGAKQAQPATSGDSKRLKVASLLLR